MSLRKLAGQTVYYGMSSIIGRFIGFVLTPIYTYSTIVTKADLGQLTELMSYTSIILIFFTLRLEIAYFRYGKVKGEEQRAYNTSITAVWGLALGLGILILLTAPFIAGLIGYADRVVFIRMLGIIMAFDALSEIPFSYLRFNNRPRKFAFVKVSSITINALLNIFFVVVCPALLAKNSLLVSSWFDPDKIVSYILFSNVLSSLTSLLMLLPEIKKARFIIDRKLLRQMYTYALPLVIVGAFGNFNEMFGRIILKWFLPGDMKENEAALGIYGANYRLTMLIALFTQAFRYAAEPFFFRQSEESGSQVIYAQVAKYYTIFSVYGFLVVTLFIDVIKYFIAPEYWEGLPVVPILLMANVFFGLYYNVSIWYRLRDRTLSGAAIIIFGSMMIVLLNWLWIPQYGYIGSAWATLITYICITGICYFWGKKIFPVPYQTRLILLFIGSAALLNYLSVLLRKIDGGSVIIQLTFGLVGIGLFTLLVWFFEKNTLKRMLRKA